MYTKLFMLALFCAMSWIFVNATNSTTRLMKRKFIPKKSTCGPNHLCTKTTSYPKLAISRLLKRNRKKFEFLSGSVIEPVDENKIINYRGPDVEENMCRTRRVSKKPLTAFDTKKRLKYIVNIDDLKQIITYETCVDNGKGCFGNEQWANDFKTICKQVYTVIRLLSISHTGKMEYAYFPVPSNCVCAYRKLNNYDYN